MNRRSFFKFLPVAPVVMITEGARAATADQAPNEAPVPLQLIAHKPTQPKPGQVPGWLMQPEMDWSKHVSMAVGNDGRLWLKSKNDEWRRVVTE
jgi:hypothetical protein